MTQNTSFDFLEQRLGDALVPVKPNPAFVQELKAALMEAPTEEAAQRGWVGFSLKTAGAVALGAGIWYLALRPAYSALRQRGDS